MEHVVTRKKLIEVALPLEAINAASVSEKQPFTPMHPRSLHIWWARLPLVAVRAVLFAQLVDDPSSCPELFPTEEDQSQERKQLFRIIEELVQWKNTTNRIVLEKAKVEIHQSWRRTCEDNRDHLQAAELFDPDRLPAFHDPFAGGGAIPMEAQRLGLKAHASDLNPVAVLINKALIEIPPRFAGKQPVNPEARRGRGSTEAQWKGTAGLADDMRYYGKWMRDEAEKRIGHLYPKVEVTAEMAQERPDLKPYLGRKLTVIAWLWARTVKSPNPAFADVDVPLASSFVLSTKKGKEAYVEPVLENGNYRFTVQVGSPPPTAKSGTKLPRGSNFRCVMSGAVITADYIRSEAQTGRMGARLMAIIAEGNRERVYISPTDTHEAIPQMAEPSWKPDLMVPTPCHDVDRLPMYGMPTWGDAFTSRQLVALTTFSDLVGEARERIRQDALAAGIPADDIPVRDGGNGATGYAEGISVLLSLGVGRSANYWSSFTPWGGNFIVQTFGRQAIPMIWDYAEGNPLSHSTSNWTGALEWIERVLKIALPALQEGKVFQYDAQIQSTSNSKIVSADPPYYDNIGYAELSDYFYVWLRRSMRSVFPELFATLAVPKVEELVASPYRHGGQEKAEMFFLQGMSRAMQRLAEQVHIAYPITIYYAFKQSEKRVERGPLAPGGKPFMTQ